MKNHQERCRTEGTCDVIFLFQVRRLSLIGYPYTDDGEYGTDDRDVVLGDVQNNRWTPREGAEPLTTEQLLEMETVDGVPCLQETWVTMSVWLTREEGEDFGESTAHNYPDGWKVYGTCANGKLADLLKST